jgi:uncharacterized membrane protein YgcG
MPRRASWPWLPALAAAWLAGAAAAAEPTPAPGTDQAGLYTPAAVQKANEEIAKIEHAEHRELVIETFKAVPEDKARAFRDMTARQREDFFQQWADERAQARHVYGVYVLISKSPRRAVVVLGPGTEERVFPERDRKTLAEELTPPVWWRNRDRQLLDAVAWFHTALHRNLRAGGPEDASTVWPWALGTIAGLLLVWGSLQLARHAIDLVGRARSGDAAPACHAEPAVTVPPLHADGHHNDLERRAEDY